MKIISTIGPVSEDNNQLKKILSYSSIIRLNGSHNELSWHKKIISRLKIINPNITILFDIPGVKPRTLNKEKLNIDKNDNVQFFFKKKVANKEVNKYIEISNYLPSLKRKENLLSVDDGKYIFKISKIRKDFVICKSKTSFILNPRKGINIKSGVYDNNIQQKKYLNFIDKIKKLPITAIGLSYIQDAKLINKIKKKFPNFLIISKIENIRGLDNVLNISKSSDAIMIDRGDLAAEIGLENLFRAIIKISDVTKKYKLPLIMATENFTSMIDNDKPSKSDIISIQHSKSIGTDCVMLSEETATSKNFLKTLSWLNKSISNNLVNKRNINNFSIIEIEKYIHQMQIVLISKKGYIFEKTLNKFSNNNVIFITNDKNTFHKSKFYKNYESIYLKKLNRAKFELDYIFNLVKKYKGLIFKNFKKAVIFHTVFPKKNMRANSLTVLDENDFI